jgi:hypothetical protein
MGVGGKHPGVDVDAFVVYWNELYIIVFLIGDGLV